MAIVQFPIHCQLKSYTKTMSRLSLIAVCLLLVVACVQASDSQNGGYHSVEVSQNDTQLLASALANETLYSAEVKTRLCFTKITSLEEQVVAGTKYRFHAAGCEIAPGKTSTGQCTAENGACTAVNYEIVVFVQSWTDTVQVVSIGPESGSNNSSSTPSVTTTSTPVPSPSPSAASTAVFSSLLVALSAILAAAMM